MTDQNAREQALDINHSFIVQAPAGSGKTELLTQRYLKLLSVCDQPESIIAITFTKKAASEMRQRILESLELANHEEPQEEHKRLTYRLAKTACEKDREQKWHLSQNPNRLRILTIDALSLSIAEQMPKLAHFAGVPNILENPDNAYKDAINSAYQYAEHDINVKNALETLLLQLDNKTELLESLLINLLKKRDQWLPHVNPNQNSNALREQLESTLQHICQDAISTLNDSLSKESKSILSELASHACHTLTHDIDFDFYTLSTWRYFKNLLLTQKNTWRSNIDKRSGFLPEHKTQKATLKELITNLSQSETLLNAFCALDTLPEQHYSDSQWQTLEALLIILPRLAAWLSLHFNQSNTSDFTEINLRALQALGDIDAPSDLALYLDYKIQHLLIDEFQDTSITQFHLLDKLLQGWQIDDGRSLFLVGDPMQSIYRFRQAEVGLFQHVQENGIADIQPLPLFLTRNFRSNNNVINWFNTTFSQVFPKQNNISQGAVRYNAASCDSDHDTSSPCQYYLYDKDRAIEDEAQLMLEAIQNTKKHYPNDSIAILAKSRNQLPFLLATLQEHDIDYSATDIDPLMQLDEVQDTLILFRILLNFNDHIGWYALLRSPFVGLTLTDIYHIAKQSEDKPLWPTLCHFETNNLSALAINRIEKLVEILNDSFSIKKQLGLIQAFHFLAQALLFNHYYQTPTEQENISVLIEKIETVLLDNPNIAIDDIYDAISALYAKAQAKPNAIEVMTIHKSKGLEFDHIFIPNLAKSPPPESHQLLVWQQSLFAHDDELTLAPIQALDGSHDATYHYCRKMEKRRLENEVARLFYVAVTRAKKAIHLFSADTKPRQGSFYALIANQFEQNSISLEVKAHDEQENENKAIQSGVELKRITTPYPPMINPVTLSDTPQPFNFDERFALRKSARIGDALHKILETTRFDASAIWTIAQHFHLKEEDSDKLFNTLAKAQQDPQFQWIMQERDNTQIEHSLFHRISNTIKHYIVDRSFIDNNTRWIIDFKSAVPHDNEDKADFVKREKALYSAQLAQYAKLYKDMEHLPIRLGLYFPLCQLWHEWKYTTEEVDYAR